MIKANPINIYNLTWFSAHYSTLHSALRSRAKFKDLSFATYHKMLNVVKAKDNNNLIYKNDFSTHLLCL